jgi:hypothetical protein
MWKKMESVDDEINKIWLTEYSPQKVLNGVTTCQSIYMHVSRR